MTSPTEGNHLRKADYIVAVASMEQCHELVKWEHYAHGGSNTATYRHGLFGRDNFMKCLGIAWWIPPTKSSAIATYPEGDWRKVLSLSRLVINPSIPTNGASFLMGRSIREIKKEGKWDCLVTYADEWQGHTGAIYKATNWEYLGMTNPEGVWINPRTGAMVARKAGGNTRTVGDMKALGYEFKGRFRKHKYRMIIACKCTMTIPMMEATP